MPDLIFPFKIGGVIVNGKSAEGHLRGIQKKLLPGKRRISQIRENTTNSGHRFVGDPIDEFVFQCTCKSVKWSDSFWPTAQPILLPQPIIGLMRHS